MNDAKNQGMSDLEYRNNAATQSEGWTDPQGMHVPEPTYAPLFLAIGMMCMLWGIVTTPLLSLVGGILFVIAISKWIGEVRHEHRNSGAK